MPGAGARMMRTAASCECPLRNSFIPAIPQDPFTLSSLRFMMSEALMWNFLELDSARPTNARFLSIIWCSNTP